MAAAHETGFARRASGSCDTCLLKAWNLAGEIPYSNANSARAHLAQDRDPAKLGAPAGTLPAEPAAR